MLATALVFQKSSLSCDSLFLLYLITSYYFLLFLIISSCYYFLLLFLTTISYYYFLLLFLTTISYYYFLLLFLTTVSCYCFLLLFLATVSCYCFLLLFLATISCYYFYCNYFSYYCQFFPPILMTFSLQVSFLPFTLAVMIAVPVPRELITPLLTTATFGLSILQLTGEVAPST